MTFGCLAFRLKTFLNASLGFNLWFVGGLLGSLGNILNFLGFGLVRGCSVRESDMGICNLLVYA